MKNETTRHKEKQEERQAGRQAGRQDLEKADTPSSTKADTLRNLNNPEGNQEERQVGRQERQNLGKADTPSNTRKHEGRQWETMGDKGETRGRQDIGKADTPSQAHMWGDWETMALIARLRHMDYCAEYGFEYQGVCSRMVMTPQTESGCD